MEIYLAELFERDLTKLRDEIKNFKDEQNIWRATNGVTNTAGTLTLHVLGNLNFTIGNHIGGNGYQRNREQEFSLTGLSREELIAQIDATIEVIKTSFQNVDQARLDQDYALEMVGKKSTAWYLTFFLSHFNYHLGQINYLRRILEA